MASRSLIPDLNFDIEETKKNLIAFIHSNQLLLNDEPSVFVDKLDEKIKEEKNLILEKESFFHPHSIENKKDEGFELNNQNKFIAINFLNDFATSPEFQKPEIFSRKLREIEAYLGQSKSTSFYTYKTKKCDTPNFDLENDFLQAPNNVLSSIHHPNLKSELSKIEKTLHSKMLETIDKISENFNQKLEANNQKITELYEHLALKDKAVSDISFQVEVIANCLESKIEGFNKSIIELNDKIEQIANFYLSELKETDNNDIKNSSKYISIQQKLSSLPNSSTILKDKEFYDELIFILKEHKRLTENSFQWNPNDILKHGATLQETCNFLEAACNIPNIKKAKIKINFDKLLKPEIKWSNELMKVLGRNEKNIAIKKLIDQISHSHFISAKFDEKILSVKAQDFQHFLVYVDNLLPMINDLTEFELNLKGGSPILPDSIEKIISHLKKKVKA